MMRADDLHLENNPLRTEMTGTKQIPTSHVFSTDESKLKEFLVDENLLQIYFTDKDRFFGIVLALRNKEVINSFTYINKLSFGS